MFWHTFSTERSEKKKFSKKCSFDYGDELNYKTKVPLNLVI